MSLEHRIERIENTALVKGARCAVLYYQPGKPMPAIPAGAARVIWYPEKVPEGAPID